MKTTIRITAILVLPFFAAGSPSADLLGLPQPITAEDYRDFDPERAKLGQLLFYDKLLSGNRNIACGTCHHPTLGTSDGLSLGVGEGGVGLGPEREIPDGENRPLKRVPRNAPALFNLGHKSVTVLFHDGRASVDGIYGNGFNTPAEEWLPPGLQSVLAAQALFPLTSQVEMAGSPDENRLAAAGNQRIDKVWDVVVERLRAVPDYVDLFAAAFDDVVGAEDITIVHVANALDDFQNSEWQSHGSPFDAYLNGEADALSDEQLRGLELFYGDAGCAACHSGPLLTDQRFHAIGLPPLGPGRTRIFDPIARDVGRMSETDLLDDAYRFRTPSLRNVAETAPYGHNGSFATLEGIVRHHLNPRRSFERWDRGQVSLPSNAVLDASDFNIWEDEREIARQKSRIELAPRRLGERDVEDIVAFLRALSDPEMPDGRLGVPDRVPSGLPVDQPASLE